MIRLRAQMTDARTQAQELLDRYRFQEGGKDIFPLTADGLTPAQIAHVLSLGEKVVRLKTLQAEQARLEGLKATLSTLTR